MGTQDPQDVTGERDLGRREPGEEMLSRLGFSDWVRIWCTMLPRHLPPRLARQLQMTNTELALRSMVISTVLGFPTWLSVLSVVVPNTPSARSWRAAPIVLVPMTMLAVGYMYWLHRHNRLTPKRFNIIQTPVALFSGATWGTIFLAVGYLPIGRFYLTVSIVAVISATGVLWTLGHWPLGVLFSSTIAAVSSASYFNLGIPEARGLAAMALVVAGATVLESVLGCYFLVRSQVHTLMAMDRQVTIDLLLNDYARSGNDWVWEVDEDTVLLDVPERMLIAGRGDDRIRPGVRLSELLAGEPDALRSMAAEEPFEVSLETIGPKGAGEIRLWGRPKFLRGRCLGYQGVGSDLGAAKREEEAQRTAERFDAMVSVTSGINHDFNNQLATVLGAVELARLSARGSDETVGYLDRAVEACMRSRTLTADLSAALGLQAAAEVVSFDVVPEIRNVIEDLVPLYPNMSVEIVGDLDVAAIADPNHFRRAARNLIENGFQANADNPASSGIVKVSLSRVQNDDGGRICIKISDDGLGVSPEIAARVFEPFFTTRRGAGGTGLGLAVARGLSRQAGGSLHLQNEEVGTTFVLELPSASLEQLTRLGRGVRLDGLDGIALRKGTYLVVEDDELVASTIVDWIHTYGAQAIWVDTVERGVALADSSPSTFECIIADIVLPDGEGFEVVDTFRRVDPRIPVVYVSGFTRRLPKDLERSLHAPFVSKPFAIAELLRALSNVGVVVARTTLTDAGGTAIP